MFIVQYKNTISQVIMAIVAAFSLLMVSWATWQTVAQPDLGVLWTDRGIVYHAKPDAEIQVNDRLVSIDGVPFSQSNFPYYDWQRGSIIQLQINRGSDLVSLEVLYTEPAPVFVLATHLSLTFVALSFWIVSLTTVLLSSVITRQHAAFFLWCQTLGMSLALGSVTSQPWAGHLSHVFTWCTVAFAIHFHLLFPFSQIKQQGQWFIFPLYGVATLGALWRLLIVVDGIVLPEGVTAVYGPAFYLWLLVGLSLILLLLLRAYRGSLSSIAKRQVGMVALFGFIAGMPLLTLVVFPKVVLNEMLLPAKFAFLFLVFIPVGYGYAIRQYQFIKLERYVSRSATTIYVIGILCTLYLYATYSLQSLLRDNLLLDSLVNVVIIMGLVVVYNPLYRRLQRLVDYLLYGGWYDYPTVVSQVVYTLELTPDVKALAETLNASIQKTMRVHWAYLLWQEQHSLQTITCLAGDAEAPFSPDMLHLSQLQNINRYLQEEQHPTTNQMILRKLRQDALSVIEQTVLDHRSIHLWVPIKGLNHSLGILILGPKYGGDLFSDEDMEILDVVSRQASAIFQNAQLIQELGVKVQENEQYQKEIIRAREEERKHIARELHDRVIQELVGLKYQFAHMTTLFALPLSDPSSKANGAEMLALQEEISVLIQTTRHLCQDLRPAALDLGLIPSIRSLVNRFELESGIATMLLIEGDRGTAVDEDTALCLFRCTDKALTNIRKHAAATHVSVRLSLQPEQVLLSITDNGLGFIVPERLGSLMEQNHFGLVGMRERVDLLNGTFQITSTPSQGTCLEVVMPLLDKTGMGENNDKT
ncbi:MAG: hypothetical protein IPM39_28020 [Chloroflexi bacterium]|nr:hypothetical protein [Chloroflexota bacterium]